MTTDVGSAVVETVGVIDGSMVDGSRVGITVSGRDVGGRDDAVVGISGAWIVGDKDAGAPPFTVILDWQLDVPTQP